MDELHWNWIAMVFRCNLVLRWLASLACISQTCIRWAEFPSLVLIEVLVRHRIHKLSELDDMGDDSSKEVH